MAERALALVAAALLLARPLVAQAPDTVLTLVDARALLQQRSPEYRAALASADAAGENVWSAWGSIIPSVTLQANFSRNEFTTRTYVDPAGPSIELEEPITDVSKSAYQALVFNWQVFQGGSQIFDISAAKSQARAADLGAVARLVQLQSQLETQYFEALKQQQLARLSRELLDARRRDLELTQARFRIAAVDQTAVLQAEIEVGRQELEVLRADQALDAARRELSVMIGLEEDVAYELRDTAAIFDPTTLDPLRLGRMARESNPELARLDAEVDAQNRSLWSARGSWLPRISLALSLSRSENIGEEGSLFELTPRNTGNNLSLSFSWPLLSGFEKKWRTGQASARLQEARHNQVAGLLEVDKEVRSAFEALVAGYQAVQLQERNVALARESVRLTTERYRIGAASYIELQQATSQATQSERGLIDARYEFMKTVARLQGAVGRPIVVRR
ncbi:MAG: TolC family protein [Gemmatimonadota bacterium]|nr:MAG: TolC family protein [Gemmatimonadota bacterium]